jgi:nucleoside-diphosphate-sugar epimerase
VRRAGVRPFVIQLSSAAVYGDPQHLPVTENEPLRPISPYGWHKLQAETVGREFMQAYGIPGAALRMFSCYGSGQRKLLLWDAANKIVVRDMHFFSTGRETRDYIHIADLARAVLCLLDQPPATEFLVANAASGRECAVAHVVDLLRLALGAEDAYSIYDGHVPEGSPLHWCANISLL